MQFVLQKNIQGFDDNLTMRRTRYGKDVAGNIDLRIASAT